MGSKTTIASAAFLLAGMGLLFSTCRKDGDDDPGHGSADAAGLSGSWSSGCLADGVKEGYAYEDVRTFDGQKFSTKFASFSDATCTVAAVTQEQVGAFAVGESVEKDGNTTTDLDITIETIFITLSNAESVQAYNSQGFCGGGWELKVKRQISRAECDEDSAGDDVDHIFEIYGVRGKNIFFGDKDAGHSGRTEAQRPVTLDESKPFSRT